MMSSSGFKSQNRSSSSEFGSKKLEAVPRSESRPLNLDPVLSTKTPEKSASLPGRFRSSDVSVSSRNVQQAFKTGLRQSPGRTVQSQSVKRRILYSPRKSEGLVKLPERFEVLGEFFNGLDTAIRLLKLRGNSTTYSNISPKLESLTNRRFLHCHLAQMKYILPEAIQMKKVLKYDESSCCMRPDLHITLDINAVPLNDKKCESKNAELRKLFRSRLADFFRTHPEDEIPEEVLPEPFHSSKTSSSLSKSSRFERVDIPKNEVEQDPCGLSISKTSSPSDSSEIELSSEEFEPHGESSILATPIKGSSTSSDGMASPSFQHTSTPARLMTSTPTLRPTKRCIMMSPDDDPFVGSPNKLPRRPSRFISLNFDSHEEDGKAGDGISAKLSGEEAEGTINENGSDNDDDDDDILSVLPKSLRQSIKEREKKAAYELDPAISQAKRRRRIIASLPKFFNVIHLLFQSTRRAVITREELLYKIIAGQVNITDRKEVEEQLSLMLELVPEWISETKASSGDLLVRINKMSAADTIREQIEEATRREISSVS